MDLWKHWEKSSGKNISEMMNDWTNKPGYPLINVNAVTWTDNGLEIKITQNKFGPKSTRSYWHVPLRYTTSADPKVIKEVMLTDRYTTLILEGIDNITGWVQFNPDHTTYCVVEYGPYLRTALIGYRWSSMSSIGKILRGQSLQKCTLLHS